MGQYTVKINDVARPITFMQQVLEIIGALTDLDTFKALPLRRIIVRFRNEK